MSALDGSQMPDSHLWAPPAFVWQRVKEALERKDGLAREVAIRVATPILSTSNISPILSPALLTAFSERGLIIATSCQQISG